MGPPADERRVAPGKQPPLGDLLPPDARRVVGFGLRHDDRHTSPPFRPQDGRTRFRHRPAVDRNRIRIEQVERPVDRAPDLASGQRCVMPFREQCPERDRVAAVDGRPVVDAVSARHLDPDDLAAALGNRCSQGIEPGNVVGAEPREDDGNPQDVLFRFDCLSFRPGEEPGRDRYPGARARLVRWQRARRERQSPT